MKTTEEDERCVLRGMQGGGAPPPSSQGAPLKSHLLTPDPVIKSHPWNIFTKLSFPDNEEVETEMARAALVWQVILFEDAAAYTVMGRRLL